MLKNSIRLSEIYIEKNRIEYKIEIEGEIRKFFTKQNFFLEYTESIEQVPEGILSIPLLTNILPIAWITNSEILIDELDKNFYECIEEVKKGYIDMYPEINFLGKITVKNIKDYSYEAKNTSCMFFSGGVDSVSSLITKLEESPTLITIWGSDIELTNSEGWRNVKKEIETFGQQRDLKNLFIKSSFRSFINYEQLDRQLKTQLKAQLKDNWWHGIQHGIGLIGHAVPYAYKNKMKTIYIPGTHNLKDLNIRCASYPTIDEKVKFSVGKVIHEGFKNARQDKLQIISNYIKEKKDNIFIRVCWKATTGKNCSRCEKCARTILGLLAEGIDPNKHGFEVNSKTLKNIQLMWKKDIVPTPMTITFWKDIQKRFKENENYWGKNVDIKWILNIDFVQHGENNRQRMQYVRLIKFPIRVLKRIKGMIYG